MLGWTGRAASSVHVLCVLDISCYELKNMLDIHEIVSVSFKFELEQPSGHMALLECDFQHTGNSDHQQTSADEFSILWK